MQLYIIFLVVHIFLPFSCPSLSNSTLPVCKKNKKTKTNWRCSATVMNEPIFTQNLGRHLEKSKIIIMNMWILTLIHFIVSRFAENYFYQCTPANSQTLELTSYNHYEQLKRQNEFNCAFFVWNVPLTLLFPSPLQCALHPSEGACSTPIWKIFPETHILGVWSHFDKVWAHYPTRTFARDNWHAPARSSTWLKTERRSPDAFSTGFVLARVRVATAEYLRPKGKRGEGDTRARERERGGMNGREAEITEKQSCTHA